VNEIAATAEMDELDNSAVLPGAGSAAIGA